MHLYVDKTFRDEILRLEKAMLGWHVHTRTLYRVYIPPFGKCWDDS